MGANRNLPLAYRPEEYDDWGTIRFAPDGEGHQRYALKVQLPTHDETVLNEHRANHTDPCEEFGRSVVTAVNNHAALKDALSGILKRYVELAGSGDCGFWDPEEEQEVIAARAALSAASASETGKEG